MQQALFFSFLKKPNLRRKKKSSTLITDTRANKNEAIDILGF